ncbi:MAG: Spy/CpxP family protein refolding chaperone [Myxococcota bacterium]|jgi:Spy/CpxP family protein refolding chaperone
MSRTLFAAGFAVLGALSMVTFSAVAAPDEPTAQVESAESDTCSKTHEGRSGKSSRSGKRDRRGGGKMMAAIESLDLTDDQRSQLDALKAERPERSGNGRQGRGEKVDLFSSEIDRDAAHASLEARYQERLGRAHTELDQTLDVLDILTPEQRLALKAEQKGERR